MGGMQQWRDPMHVMFCVASLVARGAASFMRAAGVAFVCFGMALIFAVGSIFMYAIIPLVSETALQLAGHLAMSGTLLFNIYFNYALCIATDPGFVSRHQVIDSEDDNSDDTDDAQDEISDPDDSSSEHSSDREALTQRTRVGRGEAEASDMRTALPTLHVKQPETHSAISSSVRRGRRRHPSRMSQNASYCRACRMARPLRAHHCSVCNRCVDHMDHHCPWVNNCIGRYNYRYFFTFLAWLSIGCVYAAFVSYTPAYGTLTQVQYEKVLALSQSSILQEVQIGPLVYFQFAFCMAVSVGVAVSILLGWHLYLTLTAQTSVEYQINRSARMRRRNGGKVVSPYSQGDLHANWELTFGPCPFKLASLFPSTHPPLSGRQRQKSIASAARTGRKQASDPSTPVASITADLLV